MAGTDGTEGSPLFRRESGEQDKPERIGPYKILTVLGEGGMGTVYLAEQHEPIRRRVALKLIKLGMDSKEVLKRFEAERQALAMMEHDNIAKIMDAGRSESGQPYFVMEYVKGIPITEHCDKHKSSVEDRLTLFQQVCDGIQHAHQKGVMHRDLAPRNVLVTLQGDRAVPKIIDFGLARATDHRLLTATIFTEQGAVIGTPGYMSPEQAGLDGQDVDTRTDVYALGAILYELLCGEPAFSKEYLCNKGMLEMQRIIKEEEPERPSTKLSSSINSADQVALLRKTNKSSLLKNLRGDLDLIVLKAMEKDRIRRYGTPSALSSDIARHLEGEPIEATAPGLAYVLRKFITRSPTKALAVFVVLPLFLLGLSGPVFYQQWQKAEDLAKSESEAREEADVQRAAAQKSLAEFQMVASRRRLDRARMSEKELYPAWPEQVPAMRAWLDGEIRLVSELLPQIESTNAELEGRALSETEDERIQSRESHPEYQDLLLLGKKIAALKAAQEVREGKGLGDYKIDTAMLPSDPVEVVRHVREMVDLTRREFGREREALAYTRHAFAQNEGASNSEVLITHARAQFAVGLDDDARKTAEASLENASESEKAKYRAERDALLANINEAARRGEMIAELEEQYQQLEARVSQRKLWHFADPAEGFLYDVLNPLVHEIRWFQDHQVEWVKDRLAWAEEVEQRTIENQHSQWDSAIQLAQEDFGIRLTPQMGLIPIGRDPESKLLEFYHLRSADPSQPIPKRDPETGKISVTHGTGMIFALIPGGEFSMGPQDLESRTSAVFPHDVSLEPYFLSKYEMTQGQWGRLQHGNNPSQLKTGSSAANSPAHPVENVNWDFATLALSQEGLLLPTEAQWEYACRARSTTPWSVGASASDLTKYANIADQKLASTGLQGAFDSGDDGHAYHAPVGSYSANGFGLYDMHGNLWEWCQEQLGTYLNPVREGDGFRALSGAATLQRVMRGGSFYNPASSARSDFRMQTAQGNAAYNIGFRAARAIIN